MKATIKHHTGRALLSFAAVTGLLAVPFGAPALADSGNANDKQTICHATNSDSNPYVVITPNKNGDISAHEDHDGPVWNPTLKADHVSWGDIIPPFTYNDHGTTTQFPGQNWDATGQAWFANDCQVPITAAVVKTNDADGDAAFTDDETADGVGDAVAFQVVVTNTSVVPAVVGSFVDTVAGTPISVIPSPDIVGTTLAPGQSVTVTFTVPAYAPADGAAKTNTVTVVLHQVGNTLNSATASDTSVVRTVVPRELSIVKSGPASVAPGDTFSWTLTVRNDSDGVPVSGVTVTDTLPTGTTLVSAGGPEWTTSGTTDLVFAHVGDLAAGATSTLTITVTLDPAYTAATVVNTAVVTPTDTTPGNNTSTVITPVIPPGGGGGTPPDGGGGGGTPPGFTGGGGTPTTGGGGGAVSGPGGGALPLTGFPFGWALALALLLLMAGSGLLLAPRTRRVSSLG